ncbi:MAG: DUF4340 domain-containing protein [Rubritepida sp.]|nr:DUF4340 domain-containing protein [Rubritepida sp.]
MKRRGLLLLGIAGGASVAAALLLGPAVTPPSGQAGVLAFPGLAGRLGQAVTLEIRRHEGTLIIRRAGDRWVLPERHDQPVRDAALRELLIGLTELRLVESRGADAATFARLGVDDPDAAGSTASQLRLLDGQGAVLLDIVLGRRRIRTQGGVPETVYLRRAGEAEAWLAEGSVPVGADAASWLERDIANFPAGRVSRVTINRAGARPLTLSRGGAGLLLTDPPDPPQIDRAALDDVARAFEFLTFMDAVPEGRTPGQALGQARFELTDGPAVNVWVSRNDEFLFIRLAAEGQGATAVEARLLNARWGGWAYQVGVWKEKAFLPRLEELTGA